MPSDSVLLRDATAEDLPALTAALFYAMNWQGPVRFDLVADDIPEVSLGVAPASRGQGIGSALLSQLVARARVRGLVAVSLSVEDGNRARNLYQPVATASSASSASA